MASARRRWRLSPAWGQVAWRASWGNTHAGPALGGPGVCGGRGPGLLVTWALTSPRGWGAVVSHVSPHPTHIGPQNTRRLGQHGPPPASVLRPRLAWGQG